LATKKKQILAVEDSATQGEILKFVLERKGHEVTLVMNGRRALEALARQRPDVVVTDIMMPEMDGFTLCSHIKSDPALASIPVILLTGLSNPVEVIRGLEARADGFIVKPNRPEELAGKIEETLAMREQWREEGDLLKVSFHGRDFQLASSRQQILNVLLSTYETAVGKNHDLRRAQEDLQNLALSLEEKVRERTSELAAEVAERKLAQEQLMEANQALEQKAAQLRQLAQALTRTEQKERKRLAQVLHDNLQQLLVAAKMLIGGERGRQDDGRDGRLRHVEELLSEAIDASRSLTVELCPPVLYEGGLLAGLDWLGRRMEEKYDFKVSLDLDPAAEPSNEEIRVFVFQAVRELLFNAFKHAGVNQAEVILGLMDDSVRVVVRDEGRGFPAAGRKSGATAESFGLFHLQERADLFGGVLTIHSQPGEGAEAILVVPSEPQTGGLLVGEGQSRSPLDEA
jgi:signal transduction histidine kinase